jgi:hypothetical protein
MLEPFIAEPEEHTLCIKSLRRSKLRSPRFSSSCGSQSAAKSSVKASRTVPHSFSTVTSPENCCSWSSCREKPVRLRNSSLIHPGACECLQAAHCNHHFAGSAVLRYYLLTLPAEIYLSCYSHVHRAMHQNIHLNLEIQCNGTLGVGRSHAVPWK